jgi:hypothetical protein
VRTLFGIALNLPHRGRGTDLAITPCIVSKKNVQQPARLIIGAPGIFLCQIKSIGSYRRIRRFFCDPNQRNPG